MSKSVMFNVDDARSRLTGIFEEFEKVVGDHHDSMHDLMV